MNYIPDYQNDNAGKESVATTTTSTRTSKWNETNFSWPGARVSSCKSDESDKQLLRLAPEWPGSVQTTPLLHTKTDRPHQPHPPPPVPPAHALSPSKSEHQYDVPWSHLLPRKQLTVDTGPAANKPVNDYSDIVTDVRPRSSPWSVSEDSDVSLSSNSGSVTGTVSLPQLQLTPDNFTVASVTHTGAKLSLPGWGVSLLIPPGALDNGFVEEVFLAVVPIPTPPLPDHQCMLSPVVLAGPPRLTLNKSAVLSLSHCCGIGGDQERWEADVWHTHSMVTHADWDQVATIGKDSVSSPVFASLDLDTCHVITPFLGHFCLTGQQKHSQEAAAVRHFKIVSCGQLNNSNSPVSGAGNIFVIHVYIVPDTPGSVESVVKMAEKAGNQLLTKPKHLGVQSNNCDLQCGVVSTGQVRNIHKSNCRFDIIIGVVCKTSEG